MSKKLNNSNTQILSSPALNQLPKDCPKQKTPTSKRIDAPQTTPTSKRIDAPQTTPTSKRIDAQQTIIPTSAFIPVNNLPSELKDPIKITTSKKWVLPPRPRPGRKPVSSEDSSSHEKDLLNTKSKISKPEINHCRPVPNHKKSFSPSVERNHSISNIIGDEFASGLNGALGVPHVSSPTNGSSPKPSLLCIPTPSPTPDSLSPKLDASANLSNENSKKRLVAKLNYKNSPANNKKKAATCNKTNIPKNSNTNGANKVDNAYSSSNANRTIELDCSVIHNPLKKDILKINEENYYLKLEVIRLVSNLKSLRDEVQPIVEKRKSTKSSRATKSSRKEKEKEKENKKEVEKEIETEKAKKQVREDPDSSTIIHPKAQYTHQSSKLVKSVSALNDPKQQQKDTKNQLTKTQSQSIPTSGVTTTVSSATNNNEAKTNIDSNTIITNMTTAKTTTTTIPSESKKRSHDDDINDLIVSLIDLNHSQQANDIEPVDEETLPPQKLTKDANIKLKSHIKQLKTKATAASNYSSQQHSPIFNDTTHINNPFIDFTSKSLIEKQMLYDEDDLDLLSTVSTTPSTMFSLSLSATNDTVDSLNGSTLINDMEHISELPPFDLLDLPDDQAILNKKLDVKLNYGSPNETQSFEPLNTFNTINSNCVDDFDDDIGSLELLNLENKKLSSSYFLNNRSNVFSKNNDIISSNSIYNNLAVNEPLDLNDNLDFAMSNDVDLEFENFINGKNI